MLALVTASAVAPTRAHAQDEVARPVPPPLMVAGDEERDGVTHVATDVRPAPPSELPPLNLAECTFLPEPRCEASIVAELTLAAGGSRTDIGDAELIHFTMTGGVLFQTGYTDLHVGPTFELALEAFGPPTGWTAESKVRARYFIAGTHAVVESAIGLAGTHLVYGDGATESGTRLGGVFEMGIGYRGTVGYWGQLGALGDIGGHAGSEFRAVGGIRLNLTGVGLALAAGLQALD